MASSVQAPRKVLIVSGTWPPMRCGVGDYTSRLSKQLATLAVNVHVLTSRGAKSDLRVSSGAVVDVLPVIDRWDRSLFKKAEAMIGEVKPDVVLIQWPTAVYGRSLAIQQLVGAIKKKHPNLPVITTVHEYRYFHGLGQWRARRMITGSDRTICVDPLDLQQLQKRLPKKQTEMVHIPIGSNIPRRSETFDRDVSRATLGLTQEHFAFVFFGFANPPKGLGVLLEAFQQLTQKNPRAHLVMMSQLDPKNAYHQKVLARIKALDLEEKIHRPEWQAPQTVSEVLAACDCAVLPFTDGISLKRGTVMACLEQSLPVITTQPVNATSQGTLFEGLSLVPANHSQALASAMQRCMDDAALRTKMASAANQLRHQYSWDSIAEQHLALFEDVIEESC